MDGLADKYLNITSPAAVAAQASHLRRQRTLRAPIGCVGIGLHTGRDVSLTLHPAPAGTGIVLRRSDLGVEFPARFDLVNDTRLCTLLWPEGQPEARVGTVEHVMAALAAKGVTNVVIEVDAAEIPILDGSASPFVFLIECAGLIDQVAAADTIEILSPVRVQEGEAFAELLPSHGHGLRLEVSIDFAASVIGRQSLALDLSAASFEHQLSTARTFAMAAEIEALRKAGLARGGSLDNAIVVDGERVMNPAGLHSPDEFVRHKMLDAVGDLYLAGAPIVGIFRANRPGHGINNKLLRALFADPASFVRSIAAPAQAATLRAA